MSSDSLEEKMRELGLFPPTDSDGNIRYDPEASGLAALLSAGKYSKRRRSNVAVMIVRVIFISSFLLYCLLLKHIFQTHPNMITNCFKLLSLLQLTTTLLLRRLLIFEQV